ncbi:MAG TPA: hypothetical protein VIT65_05275 [Microlunatus sp.]
MIDQRLFEIALAVRLGGGEEVEQVRVTRGLLGQIGVLRRKRGGEVNDRLAGPLVKLGFDLQRQDVAAPAVLDGLCGIPFPGRLVVEFVEQRDVVVPGQLCKRALHNLRVRPGRRERPHVLQVPRRLSARTRNRDLRSADSRSMTFAPQPSRCWRSRISRPIDQYVTSSSVFAAPC